MHMYSFIVEHRPNLMFIHFDSIDDAGHAYQWGTPKYYDAVKVIAKKMKGLIKD